MKYSIYYISFSKFEPLFANLSIYAINTFDLYKCIYDLNNLLTLLNLKIRSIQILFILKWNDLQNNEGTPKKEIRDISEISIPLL